MRKLAFAKQEESDKTIKEIEDVVIENNMDLHDFRPFNNGTKKNSYPLPRSEDTLDTLAGSEVFSSLTKRVAMGRSRWI